MAVVPVATLVSFTTTSVNAVADLNANLAALRNQFNALVTASNTLITGLTIPSPTITGNSTIAGATVTGDLLFTDGLYDIGKSAATRPRDGFFSRNVTVGGATSLTTLAVSGNSTLTGTLALTGGMVSNLTFTDATYDIGASGATRPRNLFLSGAITAGTSITLGNNLFFTGSGTSIQGFNDASGLQIGIQGVGVFWRIRNDGHFAAVTDNLYDIGQSGAVRPRHIYAAGNLVVGGTATIGGNITFGSATTKIAVPAAGGTDFRAASDLSSVLLILDTGAVQLSTGRLTTIVPTTATAGLRLQHGVAPTSPLDGDIWSTTAGLFIRVNGVTKTVTLT